MTVKQIAPQTFTDGKNTCNAQLTPNGIVSWSNGGHIIDKWACDKSGGNVSDIAPDNAWGHRSLQIRITEPFTDTMKKIFPEYTDEAAEYEDSRVEY